MIKQNKDGSWLITGAEIPDFTLSGRVGALVPNAEMQAFIHEQAQALADRALAILIEHQRHTLLPEQQEGEG